MKIDFPLFSHLTGKNIYFFLALIYEIFPRLGEIYFGELLGGKILRKASIQNGWHKLEEQWLSFVVFENIRVWFSFYVLWEFNV